MTGLAPRACKGFLEGGSGRGFVTSNASGSGRYMLHFFSRDENAPCLLHGHLHCCCSSLLARPWHSHRDLPPTRRSGNAQFASARLLRRRTARRLWIAAGPAQWPRNVPRRPYNDLQPKESRAAAFVTSGPPCCCLARCPVSRDARAVRCAARRTAATRLWARRTPHRELATTG